MRRFVLPFCLAAVAVAGSARADSASTNRSPEVVTRLPEVVVTATREATPLDDVGNAVTVISHDEIVNSQARSVPDLLRESAGLSVVQSGGPGGQTSVFTRGLNSDQTLFMIDGARINSPVTGLAALANLTPDQVERIEIVRGPQSTLYGADAMGGVVNIITRKSAGPPTGSVTLEGGSYGTFDQLADVSFATNKFGTTASFSHLYTDNPFPNDEFDNLNFADSLWYQILEKAALDATVRFTAADTGLPSEYNDGKPLTPNPTDHLHDHNYFGRVGLKLDVSDTWQQTFFIAETHEELFEVGVYPSDLRTDLAQVGWQNDVKLADWNTLTAGLDWYLNHGAYNTSGATPFNQSNNDVAGYVQDQATLWTRLTLTAGARCDHNSQFGDFVTGRGAGVLRFNETGTRLKASGGSAMRAPTLSDLYQSYPSVYGYPAFLANPNLKPEQSTGWDAGVEQDIGPRVTGSARYFENNIRDLITDVYEAPDFILENVNRVRTDGIELGLDARPVANLTCFANYTWLMEAKDLTGNTLTPRLRRPEHSANLGANYRFFNRFNAHTSLALVGSRYDYQVVAPYGIVRNGGYARWDVGLAADICKHCQVFVRLENLLDEKYEEVIGYPALGRTVIGGATAKF
jgi:vitamin B12 transporter